MILKIVNCNPANYTNDNDRHLALCNILASHGQKNNIVIGDRKLIDEIISSGLYVGSYLTYAHDIRDTLRDHAALPRTLSVYAEIDFSSKESSCNKIDNTYIFRLSYMFFIDPANSGPTDLLTENGNDYKFYNIITEYYSKHISQSRLNVKFNEFLGAGSHCKPEFSRLSGIRKLLLCIVDNDKKHPKRKEGSTSSAFTDEDREYSNNNLAFILRAREIESLIPSKTMESVIVKKSKDSISKFDRFDHLNKKHPAFKIFFDHKDGISLKEAIELDKEHGPFWMEILNDDAKISKKDCFIKRQCYNCDSCPTIDGFGDNLLSLVISESNTTSPTKFFSKIDDNIYDQWCDIGHLMISWGCSGNGRVPRS